MAFSLIRPRQNRPDDMLPAGWQLYSRPTNLEPPGTVFRIDAQGRRSIVERLKPAIDRWPEPGTARTQSIETTISALARLLGIESPRPAIPRGGTRVLRFEIANSMRESTGDAEISEALKPVLENMEFRAKNRYFLVREVRAASAITFLLSDEEMEELGGDTAIVAMGKAGVTISAREAGVSEVTKTFAERLGVMFLPEEIALVRAGLAAEEAALGSIPVNSTLDWVDPDYSVVRVFFATDRNDTGSEKPAEKFGGDRSDLSYGTCEVSIPREHRMGDLEAPSIWKLEFREDPKRHVVLLEASVMTRDEFFSGLATRVRASEKARAFLFVHGYNVTFEDAARRTAQICYDLGFDGAPVFYSWPSRGSLAGYTVDEQNIEWAQANLKGFLADFFERSEAMNLYLIAHSMGNRALTRAIAALMAERPDLRPRLTEVILAAPDIDAEVFKRDIVPPLTGAGRPITLYASSEDLALAASKKIHGYPRAGDSGRGLMVFQGIETIDATAADTSLVGHSFFAESQSILSDIFYLIRMGHRAAQRFGLRAVDVAEGRYWIFKR
jgi:esterase/lipase superfamily enzyme